MILHLILLFTLFPIADSALANCAANVRCPPGGLWSEWVGDSTCPTSCGSCSELFYTRTCLSTAINCTCSGDSSKYQLCNTKACLYPSQTSCCSPYVSMIRNGTLHCGPEPKDTSSPTTPCCPIGGMWSPWSGFERDGSTWRQTRQCISDSVGCPCTGSSVNTQSTCPCPAMISALQVRSNCQVASTDLGYSPNSFVIDQDTCQLTGICKANNLDIDWPCAPTTTWKTFQTTSILLYGVDGTCYNDYPFDCAATLEYGPNQLTLNISFTCDPSIQQWRYDESGVPVTGYQLFQRTYRGAG